MSLPRLVSAVGRGAGGGARGAGRLESAVHRARARPLAERGACHRKGQGGFRGEPHAPWAKRNIHPYAHPSPRE